MCSAFVIFYGKLFRVVVQDSEVPRVGGSNLSLCVSFFRDSEDFFPVWESFVEHERSRRTTCVIAVERWKNELRG